MNNNNSYVPQAPYLGVLREGTDDTRYYDMTADLLPVNDFIQTLGSITVTRLTGSPTTGDLTISPNDSVAPWLTMTVGGTITSTGYVVNWWEGVGDDIAQNGPVTYQITVNATTVEGRELAWDAIQLVVPSIG